MVFLDTSFLFALYRKQDNSSRADTIARAARTPLLLSTLVLLEFRQSARLQAFRFASDRSQGFSRREATGMLLALERNISAGAFVIAPVEWVDVHSIAERISAQTTMTFGGRTLGLIHLATALHLRQQTFLTFDFTQARVARRHGLNVPR